MTIHELLALTGLTGSDEIPVWDEEASGEPTKKITAQNFATAIKTLASLLGTGDVVNNLTSTSTDKPLSAAQGKALNDFAQQSTTQNLSPYSNRVTPSQTDIPRVRKTGKIVSIGGVFTVNVDLTSSQTSVMTLPSDCVPPFNMYFMVERESDRVCFPGQVSSSGNFNIIHGGALHANDVIYFGFTYLL